MCIDTTRGDADPAGTPGAAGRARHAAAGVHRDVHRGGRRLAGRGRRRRALPRPGGRADRGGPGVRAHRGRARCVFKAEIGSATAQACQIQGVWVDPALRGTGLGTRRHGGGRRATRSTSIAPVVSLYVNDFNVPARRAYERVGFTTVGVVHLGALLTRTGRQARDRLAPKRGNRPCRRISAGVYWRCRRVETPAQPRGSGHDQRGVAQGPVHRRGGGSDAARTPTPAAAADVRGTVLAGTVYLPDGRTPAVAAVVDLMLADPSGRAVPGSSFARAVTDADGAFVIDPPEWDELVAPRRRTAGSAPSCRSATSPPQAAASPTPSATRSRPSCGWSRTTARRRSTSCCRSTPTARSTPAAPSSRRPSRWRRWRGCSTTPTSLPATRTSTTRTSYRRSAWCWRRVPGSWTRSRPTGPGADAGRPPAGCSGRRATTARRTAACASRRSGGAAAAACRSRGRATTGTST